MSNSQLLVGVGKSDITPPFNTEMSGFVARKGKSQGVHDPLSAYALIFQTGAERFALVVADLIGVDAVLVTGVRKLASDLTGIPQEKIVVSATHTHSGPAVIRGGFLGEVDDSYYPVLVRNLAGAIVQANNNLEPVAVYYGSGETGIVGKNRRQSGGPTDPEVTVLRFLGEAGTKVILINYACHPVVLGPDNLLISADYPHYLRKTLEPLYPGAEIIFVNGAAGNINTGHTVRDSISGAAGNRRTFAEAERLGRILAGEVIKAVETAAEIQDYNLRFAGTRINLPLDPLPTPAEYGKMAAEWERREKELKAARASYGEIQEAVTMIRWAREMQSRLNEGVVNSRLTVEISVFSLGNCEFYTLPGEFFFEFGLMIKEKRVGRKVFILGYTNDSIGYVAPETAYEEGGYELEESYKYYGLPSRLQKGVGEKVVRSLLELIKITG